MKVSTSWSTKADSKKLSLASSLAQALPPTVAVLVADTLGAPKFRERDYGRDIFVRALFLRQQPDILCCRTSRLQPTLDLCAREQPQIVAFLVVPSDFLVAD
jgi:hypothetical protein